MLKLKEGPKRKEQRLSQDQDNVDLDWVETRQLDKVELAEIEALSTRPKYPLQHKLRSRWA